MRRFAAILFVLCCVWSLDARTAEAQTCSVQLANGIGDTVTVTATLFTNDPNENGEGEPLQVSSSGSEIVATIPAYSLPTPFTYVAVATNETISGFIVNVDGDESCTISANVNTPPPFTPDQKKTANKVALIGGLLGVGLGAAASLLACAATGGALCIALILGAAGGGATWATAGYISGDPPDSNFMVIATPTIATIPTVVAGGDLTQAEADAFNALYANEASIIGIGNAALTSANRAEGAHLAGDSFWETRQLEAAQLYANQLGGLFGAQPGILGALHDSLVAAGVSVTVTPNDVFRFESQVASYGLPSAWVQDLTAFGADNTLIGQVAQLLFVQDINAASGSFPGILISPDYVAAVHDFDDAFGGVTVDIAIKPGAGMPVAINPASGGVIPVAILGRDTFDAQSVDASSVIFGPGGALEALRPAYTDTNGDGKVDIILFFRTRDSKFKCGDIHAGLSGRTKTGQFFSGQEAMRTVGCSN